MHALPASAICYHLQHGPPNPKLPDPRRSSSPKTATAAPNRSYGRLLRERDCLPPSPWVRLLAQQWTSSNLHWLFCWCRLEHLSVRTCSPTWRLGYGNGLTIGLTPHLGLLHSSPAWLLPSSSPFPRRAHRHMAPCLVLGTGSALAVSSHLWCVPYSISGTW